MTKKNIILMFGGMSAEHEISLISSRNVFNNYDKELFNFYNIGLSKETNQFYYFDTNVFPDIKEVNDDLGQTINKKLCYLRKNKLGKSVMCVDSSDIEIPIDCAFNLIHGSYGEDGRLQGFLELLGIKYVGCNVLSSAITMHKTFSKIIAKHFGIDTLDFISFNKNNMPSFDEFVKAVGLPFFLKNDAAGSSCCVYKINDETDFNQSVKTLFSIGDTGLAEEAIDPREIELSVFSDANGKIIIAENIGEITMNGKHEFYSYECKYFDDNGANLVTDAQFSSNEIRQKLYDMARKVFEIFECRGLTRMDLFIDRKSGRILFNEASTLPGFTKISMYPALWIESGVSYMDLITRLIEAAV